MSENQEITVKYIYVHQGISLSDVNHSQSLSDQLDEQMIFSDDSNSANSSFNGVYFNDLLEVVNDEFQINDNVSNYLYSMMSLEQCFNFSQLHNLENICRSVIQSDCFCCVQKDYNIQSSQSYLYSDGIYCCQTWCESDYIGRDNVIHFVINSDIVVGDIIYSTVNIPYYKFTIFDNFNFFVDSYVTQNKTTLKEKFYLNPKVNNEYVSDFYKIQYESDIHQTILIDAKRYFVYSDRDGVIFNNGISLKQGVHNMKIRKMNTPKAYYFKINVINPYIKKDGKIYQFVQQQLENAKVLSNYQLQPLQNNEVLNDVVSVSLV